MNFLGTFSGGPYNPFPAEIGACVRAWEESECTVMHIYKHGIWPKFAKK